MVAEWPRSDLISDLIWSKIQSNSNLTIFNMNIFRVSVCVILLIQVYSDIRSCKCIIQMFLHICLCWNLYKCHTLIRSDIHCHALISETLRTFFVAISTFLHAIPFLQSLQKNIKYRFQLEHHSRTVCTQQLYRKGRFKYTRSLHHRLR